MYGQAEPTIHLVKREAFRYESESPRNDDIILWVFIASHG